MSADHSSARAPRRICFRIAIAIEAICYAPQLTAQPASATPEEVTSRGSQARGRMRVLVISGASRAWPDRVRGQVSDLPVTLLELTTDRLAVGSQNPTYPTREIATRLAEQERAALIAWWFPSSGDAAHAQAHPALIYIWVQSSQTLYRIVLPGNDAHETDHGDPATTQSALLEIGALNVRSAIRAELSISPPPTSSQTPSVEPIAVTRQSVEGQAHELWELSTSAHLGYRMYAGAPTGFWGVGLGLGIVHGAWRANLVAQYDAPSELPIPHATLILQHSELALQASFAWLRFDRAELGPWVRAGLDRVKRRTRASDDALAGTPAIVSTGASAGFGALARFLVATRQDVEICLGAVVPFPARDYVVVHTASLETSRTPTFRLQPELRVAWGVRW